jgi:hypothetical protein
MPVGTRSVVFGVALVAALSSTAPASSQGPTPPLEVRGISIEGTGPGAVRITFDRARTYRRIAGRTLLVNCRQVDPAAPLLLREPTAGELDDQVAVPARRRPIRARQRGSSVRYDVCRLEGGRFRGRGSKRHFARTLSVDVPVTEAGALYLRDVALGNRMVAALDVISALGSGGSYPAFAAVGDVIPRLVELPSPDATPAPGQLGLFSDGAQHMTIVAVTLTGRRLFIDAAGEVLTSNVPEVVAGR